MRGRFNDDDIEESVSSQLSTPTGSSIQTGKIPYESSDSDNDEDFKDAHDGGDLHLVKTEVLKSDISSKVFNI